MHSALSRRFMAFATSSILVACGGGGDGGVSVGAVATVVITPPATSTIGTLGRSLQLAAQAKDAANAVVGGTSFTWNSSNTAAATVSAAGLVTAVANGSTNITATAAGIASAPVAITVAQVVGSITVSSTSATPDTLFAATRTRQFSAVAKDSLNNNLGVAPTFTWSSGTTGVATVGAASGLVTAVADGNASIQASASGVNGARTVVVRRLAATHSVTPPTANITTAGGTQLYSGTASDSASQPITGASLAWSSRSAAVASVSPATGGTTTATAVGNGTTRIVMSVAGVAVDSATVTTTNQVTIPTSAAVSIGDDFFKSVRNNTQNPAVDTVAVNGTVTWTWTGVSSHSVLSNGSPSFTSSTIKSTGTYQFTFTATGSYAYICGVHGASMSGTIVVR